MCKRCKKLLNRAKAEGSIGNVGETVGGPFSSDGSIGKHFNPDGAVGGFVQRNLGDGKKK